MTTLDGLEISNRIWSLAVGQQDMFYVKVDRVRSSEAIAAILDVSAADPRLWTLHNTSTHGVIENWKLADTWAQSNLHQIIDRAGCNDLLVTPIAYDRESHKI